VVTAFNWFVGIIHVYEIRIITGAKLNLSTYGSRSYGTNLV